MSAPRYPLRVISFDGGGRMNVLRFTDRVLCGRKAADLAAEGLAVLVCEVKDVLNGGDEGAALPEPLAPRPRRYRSPAPRGRLSR